MNALAESLEIAADGNADPTADIYGRLIAAHPGLEADFQMDQDGGVRGSMLGQAFDCLIDLDGSDGNFAAAVLTTERANHEGYGIPQETFFLFLATIRDWMRETLGREWTAAMDAGWQDALARAEMVSV